MGLNMETQKVGRNVQGILCASVTPDTNVFDLKSIGEQQKKHILPAFRSLVSEWIATFGDSPTAASVTSSDLRMLIHAYNDEADLIYDQQLDMYHRGDIEGSPVKRKKLDAWADSVEVDGITIKTQCAVKDGIVTLHQFE